MKHISPILIIVLLLLAENVTMTQTPPKTDAAAGQADPAIVENLRAIVSIRQGMAEANERRVQSGRGETDGRHEVALAEARLRLAREIGQQNEEVNALKDILKVREQQLKDATKRAEVGATSTEDVDITRVAVLEAEVRLLRAQNNAKKL